MAKHEETPPQILKQRRIDFLNNINATEQLAEASQLLPLGLTTSEALNYPATELVIEQCDDILIAKTPDGRPLFLLTAAEMDYSEEEPNDLTEEPRAKFAFHFIYPDSLRQSLIYTGHIIHPRGNPKRDALTHDTPDLFPPTLSRLTAQSKTNIFLGRGHQLPQDINDPIHGPDAHSLYRSLLGLTENS